MYEYLAQIRCDTDKILRIEINTYWLKTIILSEAAKFIEQEIGPYFVLIELKRVEV